MRRSFALAFVLALVGSTAVALPAATGDAGKLQRQLDTLVETKGGPPGAIVVIQRDDEQKVYMAGVADLSTDAALDEHQHIRIASVAKAFSGAVALALVDQRVLSLDDTIAQRLPAYADNWGEVTLRQLLGHTSGIPELLASRVTQKRLSESPGVAPSPAGLLEPIEDDALEFAPGTKYRYSNSDNILTGLIVEQATGRPYEDVLRSEVSEKLGLTQTTLPNGPELARPFAHGYDVQDPGDPEDVSEVIAGGWSWAAGGIVSTPAELTKFVRGYVGGTLFGPTVIAQQRKVRPKGLSEPPGPGANAAGLALFRYKTRCGTVFGHTGNTLGYTQFVAATPDGTRSVTVSITAQLVPRSSDVFPALRKLEETAVCTALAGA
jgi:D-alanyl-D-alanine carboxypeptidase